MEHESSPNRLGLNAGVLQGVGSALFGSILAPVVLVKFAESVGWRNAFLMAGVPGLLLAALAWLVIRKRTAESVPAESGSTAQAGAGSPAELLHYNNIRYGVGLVCCVFGWWFATLPFIANYFVTVQGMTPDQMGKTMGMLGVAGLIGSALIPALSDRFGRKPILLIFLGLGIFYPMTILFLHGSPLQLPLMLVSYFAMGCIAIAAAAIPSEAVPAHLRAKAMGLLMGIGEIVGGVLVPAVSGILSDSVNPSAFLWVSAAMAAIGLFFVLKLIETAPARVRSTSQPVSVVV